MNRHDLWMVRAGVAGTAGVMALTGCRLSGVAQRVLDRIPEPGSICEQLDIEPEWAEVATEWWRVFNDPGLNSLVASVLGNNASLRAAWIRMEQSGYAAGAARGQYYPQVTLSAYGGRTRRLQAPDGAVETVEVWGTSAGVSYELDVWRRVATAVERADFEVQAGFYDYEAMAVSLAAAVCEAWFDINERLLAVELLRQQLASGEAALAAVEQRYERGLGVLLDVYQQRELVAGVRSQIPAAEAAVKLVRNRLAVLAGVLPGENVMVGEGWLPAAPPPVTADIDAFVVEDRPDVLVAFARLGAAEREAAQVLRDRFPVLRLNAAAGSQSIGSKDDLLDTFTGEATLGLTLPLMDGGRRRAETARAKAVASERLETYAETVRQAMREVHDARVLESSQAETVTRLEEELEATRRTLALSEERYRNGLVDYLSVLTAQSRLQRLERTVLGARRAQLSYRVQFCRALAGSDVRERRTRNDHE